MTKSTRVMILVPAIAVLMAASALLPEPRTPRTADRVVQLPTDPRHVDIVAPVLRPGSMRAVLGGSVVETKPQSRVSLSTDPATGPLARLRAWIRENPPPESWGPFLAAVTHLEEGGDRGEAARQFDEVARRYPDSPYAADSRELAAQLREMVEEDRRWREPRDVRSLPLIDQIEYHVYHLRDVRGGQFSQPGMCSVFLGAKDNAALRLREIGGPAIPRLIGLLHDRRPIRSVGYWRSFVASRTVLRYQDAAVEILQDLIPVEIYSRSTTADYLSTEPDAHREEVISRAVRWWTDNGPLGAPP